MSEPTSVTDDQRWELYWRSTAHDRYETSMGPDAIKALEEFGLEVDGQWGGTNLQTQESDNALYVRTTEERATEAALLVKKVVGYNVVLSEADDD